MSKNTVENLGQETLNYLIGGCFAGFVAYLVCMTINATYPTININGGAWAANIVLTIAVFPTVQYFMGKIPFDDLFSKKDQAPPLPQVSYEKDSQLLERLEALELKLTHIDPQIDVSLNVSCSWPLLHRHPRGRHFCIHPSYETENWDNTALLRFTKEEILNAVKRHIKELEEKNLQDLKQKQEEIEALIRKFEANIEAKEVLNGK